MNQDWMVLCLILAALPVAACRTSDCERKWNYWRPRVLAAAAAKSPWPIIPGESVGPLKLGMAEDEVLRAIGPAPPESFGKWEYPTLGLNVAISGGRVVSINAGGSSCGDPERLLSKAFPGEFADRIGMGASPKEVAAVIGEPLGPGFVKENIEYLMYHNMDLMFENGRLEWLKISLPVEK
ncbi:MAG TPA: hypothetical protein VGX68_07920 [Thermoanaerobaculia bacterium]|jgi:hypothetical protein|nr:hypothetical protein [Thermoanaerobaculia bacterium]